MTADHGEQFGEHGNFGHGLSLHDPEVHVPLVIVSPAHVPRGQVVQQAVSLRDVAATVVDLIGYEKESPFPGLSLAHTWQAPSGQVTDLISPPLSELRAPIEETIEPVQSKSGQGPLTAVLFGNNVYIRHQGGDEELYEFEADPTESYDISQKEEARPALERCRSILDGLMQETAARNRTPAADDVGIKPGFENGAAAASVVGKE